MNIEKTTIGYSKNSVNREVLIAGIARCLRLIGSDVYESGLFKKLEVIYHFDPVKRHDPSQDQYGRILRGTREKIKFLGLKICWRWHSLVRIRYDFESGLITEVVIYDKNVEDVTFKYLYQYYTINLLG